VTTVTRARRNAGTPQRRSLSAILWWSALTLAALAAWWTAGTRPTGGSGPSLGVGWPLAAAPVLIAVLGLLAVHRRRHERVPWPALLAGAYLVCAAWTITLAATSGALSERSRFVAGEAAPPLSGRLLAELAGSGVDGVAAAVLVCLVGAAATPLVAIAVRSLCGELTARRLLPVLALAPYALAGANVEALALALGAATLATATVASDPDRPGPRRLLLAAACGLLLGTAALFGYAAVLLAAGVVCVFFVRRRPLLNVAAAATFFVPLLLARAIGLDWTADLAGALRVDAATGLGLLGSGLAAAVVLLVLGGPALAASLRSIRTTPGWPFLVAGAAVVFAGVVAGLVTDRVNPGSWLPGLPWLLMAATAPDRQGGPSIPTPVSVLAVGSASAYAVALLGQAG